MFSLYHLANCSRSRYCVPVMYKSRCCKTVWKLGTPICPYHAD